MKCVDKNMEKLETTYIAGGNEKYHSHFIWPNNFTPRYLPEKNENMYSHKNFCMNVHYL